MTSPAIATEQLHGDSRTWSALALLYGIIVLMLCLTWGRMSDVIIDFGRELYIPWQLSEGKVLYQDIAYFNGPVSPLFNAWMFQCFGVSTATLTVVNALILATIVTLVFIQLRRFFSVATTLFSLVAFLLVQGFGHTAGFGNYNYISPYSHEMTHGVALSMLVLWLLHRNATPRLGELAATGICWGLALLTKPEFFVAISGAIFVSVIVPVVKRIDSPYQLARNTMTILAGTFVTILVFWSILNAYGGAQVAWQGIAGAWYWIFNSDVAELEYYRKRAGTDQLLLNSLLLIRHCLAAALLGFATWLVTRNRNGKSLLTAAICITCVFLLTGTLLPVVLNGRVTAGATILLSLICARKLFRAYPKRGLTLAGFKGSDPIWDWHFSDDKQEFRNQLHLFAWCTLATLLLLKIILNVELFEYGFALAMPALVLIIPAAIQWLPQRIFQTTPQQSQFRAVMVAAVTVEVFACCFVSATVLASKDQPIENSQSDFLLTHSASIGPGFEQTILFLEENCDPDATILALPEGVMINYLLRRENPTPFVNFMPPELEMFNESRIVQQFDRAPSDYVLLVNRRVSNYGKDHFGEPGFGDQIMQWVNRNYVPVRTFGSEPDENRRFGITLLKRAPGKLAAVDR